MTRHGNIQERHLVAERIANDTVLQRAIAMDARIPVWNSTFDVQCHQITLPLNHLFLRLRNARTTDTQIAFVSSDHDFHHPSTFLSLFFKLSSILAPSE